MMIIWDGQSEVTTETIVGAYGSRAKYVGPAKDEGVVVVQFLETGVTMLIQNNALTTPPEEKSLAIKTMIDKIMAADISISSEAAEAAANSLYESTH